MLPIYSSQQHQVCLSHACEYGHSVGDEGHVPQNIFLLAHDWRGEQLLHGLRRLALGCVRVEDVDAIPEPAQQG